jgi:hypothetical protein
MANEYVVEFTDQNFGSDVEASTNGLWSWTSGRPGAGRAGWLLRSSSSSRRVRRARQVGKLNVDDSPDTAVITASVPSPPLLVQMDRPWAGSWVPCRGSTSRSSFSSICQLQSNARTGALRCSRLSSCPDPVSNTILSRRDGALPRCSELVRSSGNHQRGRLIQMTSPPPDPKLPWQN